MSAEKTRGESEVPAQVTALLTRAIDYAGMYPPERLPLETAFQRYLAYRTQTDRWMLNSFILPASRLADLEAFSGEFGTDLSLVLTSRGGDGFGDFLANLDRDLLDTRRFLERHGETVRIAAYETRLPDEVLDGAVTRETGEILRDVVERVEIALKPVPAVFFEASWREQWRRRFDTLLAELRTLDASNAAYKAPPGFKLRCGGVNPENVPSVEIVAAAIFGSVRASLPLKLTAGLHHPVRAHHEIFGGVMHGFLNLYFAVAVAQHTSADERLLREILEEENPRAFRLLSKGLRWREITLTVEQLEATRRTALAGHGSCSFDEPREDLMKLKWLPRQALN